MPKQRVNNSSIIPAPTGGWNARDALGSMDPADAITLENWVPDSFSVSNAPGYALHNSIDSGTGPVGTVVEYMKKDGTRQLIAFKNNKMWNATTAGATAVDLTGALTITNIRWQCVNFRTLTASYLVCCNGVDNPIIYDGTTASNPAYTKADGSSIPQTGLIHPSVYNSRLYFTEKDSSRVWYLPVGAVSGAMDNNSGFDFSSLFTRGGYNLWTSSWGASNSESIISYFVVMSNTGECLLYRGLNPTSADWILVARLFFPPPLAANTGTNDTTLGRRSYFHLDSDLIVLTLQGGFSLRDAYNKAGGGDTSATQRKFTDKIQEAFNTAAVLGGNLFGWEAVVSSKYHIVLINIPITQNVVSNQYGIDTISGAWFNIVGKNASCWTTFKEDLYFGGCNGKIYNGWTGNTFDGAVIPQKLQTAYTYAEDTERVKRFMEVKPLLTVDGTFTTNFGVETDFRQKPMSTNTFSLSLRNGTLWDTAQWDSFYWAEDTFTADSWVGVDGIGRAVSARMEGSNNVSVSLNGFHIKYEAGGIS